MARGLRHAHSLTTGQINEVQLADLDLLRHVIAVVLGPTGLPVLLQHGHLLDDDDEHRVGARRKIIHFRRGGGSALGTLLHECVDFVG